jgi:D-glycero-D-manno-heptose 1,7-bisphosphate phosphatase
MNKAVFIDRDGVINNDEGHYYIYKAKDFKLNPGIIEGLKLLQDAGFKLFVITNQGGVAKGEYSEDDVEIVHGHFYNSCLITISVLQISTIARTTIRLRVATAASQSLV